MTEAIAISIRSVDNGFVASFNGEQPGMQGQELVGRAAGEIRDAVLAEFTKRLDAAMTSLTTSHA